MKSFGTLYLVPTSIEELGEILPSLKQRLLKAWQDSQMIVVEDEKPARRRWRAWDLPREAIEDFICYNEHTRADIEKDLIEQLKKGRDLYLMSDGGMPGFCDPGRGLIFFAHLENIKVRCLDIANSLISAVALSGLTEGAFNFLGFAPRKSDERKQFFSSLLEQSGVQVFMDTPYRLEKCVNEVLSAMNCRDQKLPANKTYFCLCLDINREEEEVIMCQASELAKRSGQLGKREFVFVIAPHFSHDLPR